MATPKELHEAAEKAKLAAMPKEVKEAKIAKAKEMLEKGQIAQHHYDGIVANLSK